MPVFVWFLWSYSSSKSLLVCWKEININIISCDCYILGIFGAKSIHGEVLETREKPGKSQQLLLKLLQLALIYCNFGLICLSVSTNSKSSLLSFCVFLYRHLILCLSGKSLPGGSSVILSQIVEGKKSTKLYTLTMDFIVLLKRVDSFTNSLNVSSAASLKLKNSAGKSLTRCYEMEHANIEFRYRRLVITENILLSSYQTKHCFNKTAELLNLVLPKWTRGSKGLNTY